MLSLGNALMSTKSRRIPFAAELQQQLAASRVPGNWRSAVLVVAATAVLWLSY